MIEVSAVASPALALPGAVIPAVPAAASAEGTQNVDFSALLAGAALATEAPAALGEAPLPPQLPAILSGKLAAATPAINGKTGSPGNVSGKLLPPGKLPVTRKAEAEETPAAKEVRETQTSELEASLSARGSDTLDVASPIVQPDAASGSAQPLPQSAMSAPTTSSAMVSQAQRTSPQPATPTLTPTPTPAIAAALAQITPALSVATLAMEAQPIVDVKAAAPSQQTVAAITAETMPATQIAVPSKGNRSTANIATSASSTAVRVADDARPALAITQDATAAPAKVASVAPVSTPADDAHVSTTVPTTAVAEPAEHKPTHALQATVEPSVLAARTETIVAPAPAETRGASPPPSVASAAAASPTQDIAALVDRITEARAAAAPHVVRAAIVHEDFGAVSLNFRTEDAHIHVTLGSADPSFAPAVHAAAAASLAGGTKDDNARRENPTPEPAAQAQDPATQNNASSQQQTPRERAASAGERTTPREPAFRQPSGSAERGETSSAPQRRSGIYA